VSSNAFCSPRKIESAVSYYKRLEEADTEEGYTRFAIPGVILLFGVYLASRLLAHRNLFDLLSLVPVAVMGNSFANVIIPARKKLFMDHISAADSMEIVCSIMNEHIMIAVLVVAVGTLQYIAHRQTEVTLSKPVKLSNNTSAK